MKRAFFLLALACTAAAQVDEAPPKGEIIMYRPSTIVGAVIGCPIRYKQVEIVELGRGKYATWKVPAGRYILTNKTSSVEVAVESGETRYVRCGIKMGMLTGRADLQIADKETFSEHRADYEMKTVTEPPTGQQQ